MATRVWQLQYDIPQPNGVPVCDNPSGSLYAAGCVRTTDSVWIVREDDLNGRRMMLVLDFLSRHGVTWFTLLLDLSNAATIRELALRSLRSEVASRKASAEQTRAAAEERFADESDTNYKARRRQLLAAARQLDTQVATMLRRIAFAASRFDIGESEIRAGEAAADCVTIAENMRDRAAAFAKAHGIVTRSRKARNDGITQSLFNDEIPVGIIADYLEEFEGEEGVEVAGEIRTSFGIV